MLLLVLTVNSLIRFDLFVLEIKTDKIKTDTHIVRTDAPETIPYQNLLMVNQNVVIVSVAASTT